MKTAHCLPCATLLSLCCWPAAPPPPRPCSIRHFGESVALLKAQQIMYPDAYRNTDPVSGIDGKAGVSAYQRYQKSFSAPEPQTECLHHRRGRTPVGASPAMHSPQATRRQP